MSVAVAAAFTFLPATARAQQLGGAASPDVSLVRVFLALLVCLVIAVLALLLLRSRFGGRMPAFLPRLPVNRGRIRLIESRRISPQAEASLIECGGREYLMVVGAGGILLLDEREATEPGEPGLGDRP